SKILWIQQLGRGLRRADGKGHLRVIDYIGNHRSFLNRPSILFGLSPGDAHIRAALARYQASDFELPAGCEVTYDLESINILEALLSPPTKDEALRSYYTDYVGHAGSRPTAIDAYHDNYNPGTLRSTYGSWPGFVQAMGGFSPEEEELFSTAAARGLLLELETTRLNKCFKAVVLLAALNLNGLPGSTAIDALQAEVRRIVTRVDVFAREFGQTDDPPRDLKALLVKWPISHLIGTGAGAGSAYFNYRGGHLEVSIELTNDQVPLFHDWARELLDWRLAAYLDRPKVLVATSPGALPIACNVSHISGRPMLFFQQGRDKREDIPEGPTPIHINNNDYIAEFRKIDVAVVHKDGDKTNLLPKILLDWFGPDTGKPGTRFMTQFRREGELLILEPRP
ncbi:MAG: hypothetical protein CMJ87_05805, partial [Planctomycetes bacterium]|nr:hypothetical protein [Planctomycetota bacterium]